MRQFLFFLILLCMLPLVLSGATSDYNYNIILSAPADGSDLYPRDINFSWIVNTTGVVLNASDTLNCSILNSTTNNNFSVFGGPFNVTNGTFANATVLAVKYGKTYWKVNCSTMFTEINQTHGVSGTWSFDIRNRTVFDLIAPVDDATLSGVDVNFSWRVNATNFNLRDGDSALLCTVRNASSVSGVKSDLFTLNTTNATETHRVFAMAPQSDFVNVYWNLNCSNGSIDFISSDFNFGMQVNSEYTWQVPDDDATLGDIVINYSWRIGVIDINPQPGNSFNCSVQNTSNMAEGANLTELFSPINTTNNTIQHQVYTMENRRPVAWRVHCTNGSIDFFSSVYNLGIDYSLKTTNVNPSQGEVLTSRFVNYSWKVEALNINLSVFNNLSCDVWRNGTAIFSGINTTNATERNMSLTTLNGVYSMVTNCTSNRGEVFYNESSATLFTVAESINESFFKYTLLNPPAYDIQPSTTINFSWIVNFTGGFLDTGDQLECSLNNRSNSSQVYTQLFRANITNATFFNQSVDMKLNERHSWFVNCSTPYQINAPYGLSDVRLFDIVEIETFYKYGIGFFDKFNITLTTGDTQIAGDLSVAGGLFVDATTNFVGIGTIVPTSALTTAGNFTLTGGNMSIGSATDPTNFTMFSPDGSQWDCGPDDAGGFTCS